MIHWSTKYVGIPFKINGRTPVGFDCWGLVRHVLKEEFGKDLPMLIITDYAGPALAQRFMERRPTVEADKVLFPFEGAIVVMNTCNRPTHVGICTDANHVLHIEYGKGSIVERLDSRRISYRIEGYYDV